MLSFYNRCSCVNYSRFSPGENICCKDIPQGKSYFTLVSEVKAHTRCKSTTCCSLNQALICPFCQTGDAQAVEVSVFCFFYRENKIPADLNWLFLWLLFFVIIDLSWGWAFISSVLWGVLITLHKLHYLIKSVGHKTSLQLSLTG